MFVSMNGIDWLHAWARICKSFVQSNTTKTWPVTAVGKSETQVIDVLCQEPAALCTFVSDLHLHLLVQQHVKFPASFDLADLQPPELYRFLVYLPASKTILWYFMLLNSSYLYLVSTLQATNRVGRRDLRGDGVGHRSDVINHEAAEAVSDYPSSKKAERTLACAGSFPAGLEPFQTMIVQDIDPALH